MKTIKITEQSEPVTPLSTVEDIQSCYKKTFGSTYDYLVDEFAESMMSWLEPNHSYILIDWINFNGRIYPIITDIKNVKILKNTE